MIDFRQIGFQNPAMQRYAASMFVCKATQGETARSIPNGRLDSWVILQGSFEIFAPAYGAYLPVAAAGIMPLSSKPLMFRITSDLCCFNIKFFPTLLNWPPFCNWSSQNHNVSFDAFFSLAPLWHSLGGAQHLHDKAACVESFLLGVLEQNKVEDSWLDAVLLDIETSEEEPRLDHLAARHFVSPKTLQRMFQQRLGMNPKTYLKLVRFQRAASDIQLTRLTHSAAKSMGLSLRHGYFDQSHFTRDCKALTGLNPRRLFDRLPGNVTDLVTQGVQHTPD